MNATWGSLKKGDTITCPGDGREEKITFARSNANGIVHVRTSRHDHYKARHAAAPKKES